MKTSLSPANHWLLAALASMLLLLFWAYWPGLHGPFLFDDFGSLPALGATGPVHSWPVFWRYITSGHADPTGRPLALLSFLLDARNWPASPWPFKLSNLILHGINGLLLIALLWRLGRALQPTGPRAIQAALMGAALWLLHPLLVSTTLYIVQREAMLAGTFVLLGLLAWLHGRTRLRAGQVRRGVLWMLLGLGGGTLLAVLSKANGALLPLYALLIEWLLLARFQPMSEQRSRRIYQGWMAVLAWLPSILLLGYLVQVGIATAIHGTGVRPWSEGQRLLTEPRVLWHYLDLLWLPRPYSAGLFYDGYVWSRSLWQPLTTLPAILSVFGLLALSWALRRRKPLLALAVLFYFAGQLLESTTIPLELVFEHRNYIPAMLMFWPLAWWLTDLRSLKTLKISLLVVLPLSLAVLTHTRAELWGNRSAQALQWARINPDSPRAQAYAVQFEIDADRPQRAIQRITPLLHRDPSQIQLAFNLLNARCAMGGVKQADLDAAATAMHTTHNPNSLLPTWFARAIHAAQHKVCAGLTLGALRTLLQAGLDNRFLQTQAGRMQDLHYVLGRIDLAQGQAHAATGGFEQALGYVIRPGFAANSAALLGSAGYPAMGLAVLNRYRALSPQAVKPRLGMAMIHAWVLRRQDYWPRELARLRATLRANIAPSATHQEPARGT